MRDGCIDDLCHMCMCHAVQFMFFVHVVVMHITSYVGISYETMGTAITMVAADGLTACGKQYTCYRQLAMEHSVTCPIAVRTRQGQSESWCVCGG